jgi:hypothetical protein
MEAAGPRTTLVAVNDQPATTRSVPRAPGGHQLAGAALRDYGLAGGREWQRAGPVLGRSLGGDSSHDYEERIALFC